MKHNNLTIFAPDSHEKTTKEHPDHWRLFIDGAARKNPGPAGAGIYLCKNDKPIVKKGFYLGSKTNNQAEYAALLLGLYFFHEHDGVADHLDIFSDSELLVKQFKGEYRVKHPELLPLHLLAKKMLQGVHFSIAHVMREKNEIADEMANAGIDKKVSLPTGFITLLEKHAISW
jgi:ribonuclease HI